VYFLYYQIPFTQLVKIRKREILWAWHKVFFFCKLILIIPVSRRVKGYTRFVEKYVTGRMMRFRPYEVYIFLIRINSRVDLAMSVCPSASLLVWTSRSQDL